MVKGTQRGLAIGLNEFAGYSGVALAAAVSGYIAASYSLRPEPFYLGIAIVIVGLSSCSFAGLSTNLKDGMAWGLFPLYFASAGLSITQIGTLVALYPASWGFFQLFTGVLSDHIGRKWMIGRNVDAGSCDLVDFIYE